MSGKFSDFSKTNFSQQKNSGAKESSFSNSGNSGNSGKNASSGANEKYIDDMMRKYSNMDQNELMQEFLRQSAMEKRKGNLDANYFENIKSTLSPYLSREQLENFDKIVNMVK